MYASKNTNTVNRVFRHWILPNGPLAQYPYKAGHKASGVRCYTPHDIDRYLTIRSGKIIPYSEDTRNSWSQ